MKNFLLVFLVLSPFFLISEIKVSLNQYGHIVNLGVEKNSDQELFWQDNEIWLELDDLKMKGNSVYRFDKGFVTLTTVEENVPSQIRIYDLLGEELKHWICERIINFSITSAGFACFFDGDNINVLDLVKLEIEKYSGSSIFSIDPQGIPIYWDHQSKQVVCGKEKYQLVEIVSDLLFLGQDLIVCGRQNLYRGINENLQKIFHANGTIFEARIIDDQLYFVERSSSSDQVFYQLWNTRNFENFQSIETKIRDRNHFRTHDPIPAPLNYDQASYPFPIGNSYGEIQQYGYSPYLHPGVDFLGDDYQEVYAVEPGYVKAVLTTGGDAYWRIAIAQENTSDLTEGYLYAHLNQSSITVSVGDSVIAGEMLGTLYPWGFADFTHIHFSRLEDQGNIWDGDWWTIDNPHVDVVNLLDLTPPVFENTIDEDIFAFRTQTGTYLDSNNLFGDFDIITKCHDICNSTWKIDVWDLSYSLHPAEQPDSVLFSRFAYAFDMPLDTYIYGNFDNMVLYTIYSRDNICFSNGNYDEREYYHIITNSNGDSLFTEEDADEVFHSAQFSDGEYLIKITARDASLNSSSASMLVTFNNGVYNDNNQISTHKVFLEQNHPNPFNPNTYIRFNLLEGARIKLQVYNLKGELVDTIYQGFLNKGNYSYCWQADEMPSGIYLYSLKYDQNRITQKMILTK